MNEPQFKLCISFVYTTISLLQVSDCYYSTYAELGMDERRLKLAAKYFFDCRCRACVERWPTHDQLPKGFDDAKIRVSLESLPAEMGVIQKLGSTISIEQRSENYEKLVTLYIEFMKQIQKVVDPPHAFYFMASRHLYKCFWIINGSKARMA